MLNKQESGIQKCGEWLGWLCEHLYRNHKADYRLHYTIGRFELGMKEMVLTGTEQGEKVNNFKSFGEKDIVTGDRAYCGKQGIEYLSAVGSDFLLRFGRKRFDVYNVLGRKVEVPGYFKGLKRGENAVLWCEGEYKPLRFCVMKKTKEAEEQGLEALRKTRMRKHGDKELSKVQKAYNRSGIIVTSITDAAPAAIPNSKKDA